MSSRREKAFNEPIYLLNMKKPDNNSNRQFNVMGTSGNKYKITIGNICVCTCPDFANGNLCKHIYFILLRVMKITIAVKLKYKDEQLQLMFHNIPHFIADDIAYNKNTQDEYKKNFVSEMKIIEQKFDDICPICLDDIPNNNNNVDYCKYGCGKSVHKLCFNILTKNMGTQNCLFCRSKWSNNVVNEEDEEYDDDIDYDDDYDDYDDYEEYEEYEEDDDVYYADYYNEKCNNNNYVKNNNNNIKNNDIQKKYKVIELQNLCKQHKLPFYGTKNIMIKRLKNNKCLL